MCEVGKQLVGCETYSYVRGKDQMNKNPASSFVSSRLILYSFSLYQKLMNKWASKHPIAKKQVIGMDKSQFL